VTCSFLVYIDVLSQKLRENYANNEKIISVRIASPESETGPSECKSIIDVRCFSHNRN